MNVMTSRVNRKTVSCVLVMAHVSVGYVGVKQTGLVTPAAVQFLQRTVDLRKRVHSALVMDSAFVVLASAVKSIWENTVKNRFPL